MKQRGGGGRYNIFGTYFATTRKSLRNRRWPDIKLENECTLIARLTAAVIARRIIAHNNIIVMTLIIICRATGKQGHDDGGSTVCSIDNAHDNNIIIK